MKKINREDLRGRLGVSDYKNEGETVYKIIVAYRIGYTIYLLGRMNKNNYNRSND